MSDESYSFSTARARLEEIVTQVRKKDTSLEKSLDLLEEGVRLANACTELIDHADWSAAGIGEAGSPAAEPQSASESDDAEPRTVADAGQGVGAESALVDEQVADSGDAAGVPEADEDADGFDAADEAWAEEAADAAGEA